MKKPNFFIIGAPKCGTSSLAAWLSEHPRIFFSRFKEPSFFSTDRKFVGRFTLREYEAMFEDAGPSHVAVGEGSTQYLLSRVAVKSILEYTENPRFIVCLRDPVEMAVSMYGQLRKMGIENQPDFEKAWRLQPERAGGRFIPLLSRNVDPATLQYRTKCMLGEQIERLFQTVDRDSVLVLLLDDMRVEPRREYLRVLSFLDVEDDGRNSFPVHNPAQHMPMRFSQMMQFVTQLKRVFGVRRRFGLLRPFEKRLKKQGGKPVISEAFRRELAQCFQEDVARLQELIDRDLSHWQPLQQHGDME